MVEHLLMTGQRHKDRLLWWIRAVFDLTILIWDTAGHVIVLSPSLHINDWHYVGSALGIPSIDALKTAIYRYGPITSAMVAPKSFLAYKGGIYNDNTESKETVDHMVVIVGWDDNYGNGAFIIRNSWGEYWGENGYGYIEYGRHNLGMVLTTLNMAIL